MDHRAEAEKYLRIDAETENSALGKDALGHAEVHALLDVADAIREQTEALTGDDKRAILIERNQ
jgi:hypothetical protein